MKRSLILLVAVALAVAMAVVAMGPAGGQATDQPDRLRIGEVVAGTDEHGSYVMVEPVPLTVYKNTQGGGQPIPDQDYELAVLADEQGGTLTFSAVSVQEEWEPPSLSICSAHGPPTGVNWRIDDTAVRNPSRLPSARIFSISGWSPTAVATKPSWSVTARARSIAARMNSVGCQRNLPMPKVAQQ